ncbi:MAG: YaeQ family protein [Burkholderiaceae bacterium]
MALRSTVYKLDLQVADTDRGHYADHALTLARHPSETEERMMVRVLAFALNADEALAFGRGLSTDDEPDLWRKDLTGVIEQWIDVGLPDEKLLRRACGRAREVIVYAYGGARMQVWWAQNGAALARCENLTVFELAPADTAALARLAARAMKIGCTIQEGHAWLSTDSETIEIAPRRLSVS